MTNYKQTAIMIVCVGLIAICAVGCKENISQQDEGSLPQISTTDRIIKVDDLLNSSFKKSKQYATDGLPGAEALQGLGKDERSQRGLRGGVVRLVFIMSCKFLEIAMLRSIVT